MQQRELARLEQLVRRIERDHDWAVGIELRGDDAVRIVDLSSTNTESGENTTALSEWCSAAEARAWLRGYEAGQERAGNTEGTRPRRRGLR